MSDQLFPRPARHLRLRLAALAVAAATALAAFSAYLGLHFIGAVGNDVRLTVHVASLGDSLGINSSVKYRGLRIGRVLGVDDGAGPGGAYTAHVVLDKQYAGWVPDDVVARVLPGTIFGADYVDLVLPPTTTPAIAAGRRSVVSGQVVAADTSAPTIRLMDTFDATQRVLGAIDPASMEEALSQLASAMQGRGSEIRGFIVRADHLLEVTGHAEPALYADLDLIARNLRSLSALEPTFARSVRDSLPTARTIAAHARQELALEAASARLFNQIADFLRQHGAQLTQFMTALVPTYQAFVGGIGPFTAILRSASAVLENGAGAVKNGAIQMKAQLNLNVVNPYTAADCPRYGAMRGSNCR